jgi:photosystem II stability/assembly factor-like uncharacterized protein
MRYFIFLIVFIFGTVVPAHSSAKIPSDQNLTKKGSGFTIPEAPLRCPKNRPWTFKNISTWIHQPIETVNLLKTQRALDTTALCTMPTSKLNRAIEKVLNPPKPDQPDKAMEFRMQQLSVYGVVKPDGMIKAAEERKKIVKTTQKILYKRYLKRLGIVPDTAHASLTASSLSTTVSLSREDWDFMGPGNIGGRIRTLFIHPTDTSLLFAGSVGGGIWKSQDGGTSWEAVDDFMANLAVTSIAADPRTTGETNSTVLYASTGEGFYNIDGLRGYGIFKSTDGGETWDHLASTDPTTQDRDWYYVNRITINPRGVIIAVARDNAVFTSTDDGDTWSKSAPGPNWYSMMEDAQFDPNDENKAIVGSISGNIYYTTDSGSTWTEVNIVDASSSWISGRVEITYAPSSPNVVYASVDHNSGEIYRSSDGGATWNYLSNPQHLGSQGWYANAIWVDPTDADHLVIGGLDLYRSTDGGVNWEKISTWWRSPSSPHADHHFIIHDPNYNGSDNLRVYNTNDGGLYKADDITATNDGSSNNGWTNLNNTLGVTQFYGAAGRPGSKIIGGTQDNGALIQADDNNTDNWGKTFGGDGGRAAVSHQDDPTKYFYFGEYTQLRIHRSDDGVGADYIYENGLNDAGGDANFISPFYLDPNNDNTMLAGGASLWRSTNVSTVDEADITWTKIKDAVDGTRISQITIAEGDSDSVLVGYNDGSIYKSTDATSAAPTWTKIHDANGKNVLALLIDKDDHTIFYAGWGGFAAGNLNQSKDSGATWNDISQGLPEVPVRAIVRHPTRSDYLYVGTEVGIFTSEDQGESWFATNNGPANVSVDDLFWYDDAILVAATHGRGIFTAKIELGPCEEVNHPLKSYQWSLVSFPCNTGDNTISDLLGNALGTYGDDANWIMYEQTGSDDYKGDNTDKRLMDANDTVVPGKGYWIITDGNKTMTIDHTLPNLSFTTETDVSDLNISDVNFTTLFQMQLSDSDADSIKKMILGNPFPEAIHLNNVYFSHNHANDGYHPMSTDTDENNNPNALYIEGDVYTTDENSSDIYIAISPDTPGFSNVIEPMTAFYIELKSGETGTNYLALPHEE